MAVRVYQIAKEYSRSNEEVMNILKEAGIHVSSQTAELDQHALHTIRARLGKFNLTVVDGENGAEPTAGESNDDSSAKKGPGIVNKKKKAKAESEPAPKLGVRVIKKHDEPKDEVEEEQPKEKRVSEVTIEDKLPKPKPKPRLKKPRRKVDLEKRIHQLAEARTKEGDVVPVEPASSEKRDERRTHAPQDRGPRARQERDLSSALLNSNRGGGGGGGRGPRHGGPGGPRQDRGPGGGRGPGGPGGGRGPGGPGGGRGPGGPGGGGGGRNSGGQARLGDVARHNKAGRTRGSGPSQAAPSAMIPPPSLKNDNRFGKGAKPSAKKKRRKKKNQEQIEKIKPRTLSKVELPEEELGIIMLSEGVTVKELAEKVNRMAKDVIKRLFEKGVLATLNDVLDTDLAIDLAKDFGYLAEIVSFEEDLQIREEEGGESDTRSEADDGPMETRWPIVTIMGHVDHGKTTLLDAIRSTKVASGEAGGITQHIGAYSVDYNDKSIVFLDTPGHEAFTKMRARGASVTDIVILVVAADDGVKPQTIEAINHAKAAKVPIIVAINKIDKPEADPNRVKTMLTEHELVVEDFGGDAPSVEVSAKQRIGLEDLLEMIQLVADLNDFKANPSRRARGTVIESRLDRGRGPVATVIVQDGTLAVGDHFITGSTLGKIRAMYDDMGKTIQVAGPATPVEILGCQEVPVAGDPFQVVEDEATARQISTFRKEKAREEQFRHQKHTNLDQLFSAMKQDEVRELPLIIKADVQGSVEGMVFALNKIKSEKVQLRFVHQGVGNITENDVNLAMAADAIIIGFNVKTEGKAESLAEAEGIDVRNHSIIYEVVQEIERAMLGLMEPEYEEHELGKAYVKQIFEVAKLGQVAGCYVDSGKVKKDCIVKVIRGGEEIHTGKVATLKRFRDDASEVKAGTECGIGVSGFSSFREQDFLHFYELVAVKATKLS